ncbi:MAG: apolipoprotein N-acyltransferase [Flavobacteriales bacterium]
MMRSRPYLLAALLTGALWFLAWPAIGGVTPLAFFAWVPLLLAEERFARSPRDGRPGHFMPFVMQALLVWNLCTTWWLYCVSESAGVKLFTLIGPNVGNVLVMSVPWALMRLMRRWTDGRTARLALVIFWIAFERFHMHWDLSWPWLTLGNVFAEHPAWVQWYEITGTLGGTLWVWCANLLVFQGVRSAWSRSAVLRPALLAAAVIALPVIGSFIRYSTFQEQGDPVEVVVVQPSVDSYTEKFGGVDALQQLDRMLRQAKPLMSPRTALVLLPETALQEASTLSNEEGRLVFHGLWENDLEHSQSVAHIRTFLGEHPGASFLGGMASSYLYPTGAQYPLTARMLDGLGRAFDAYNAALLVRPDGSVEPYHKSKLVPGVELMPFEQVLGPLGGLALDLGGATGSLGVQEEREVMSTADGRVKAAPVICYESIYGDHVAAHVRNGATIITIMTNDGWWTDSPGYKQHLAYGRLRAVETRRSIARSANTGISAIIDQRGDVQQRTAWWVPAAIRATLLARTDLTFFTRHGDYIGKGAEWGALLTLLYGVIVAWRRKHA